MTTKTTRAEAPTAGRSPLPAQRPAPLWLLLLLQGCCTLFFAFDSVLDMMGLEDAPHFEGFQIFEYLVTAALLGGVIFTAVELRKLYRRQARLNEQLSVAAGALEEILEAHFEDWSLTPAERDVARLSIKGFSIAEMAELRQSKEGTIKAQSAAVYRKAGVSGRLQLMSLFLEELIADPPLPEGAGVR